MPKIRIFISAAFKAPLSYYNQYPGPVPDTMTTSAEHTGKLAFLSGGGEMGELIRGYNWAESTLGPPDYWPLSLRTLLGVVLHSAAPMVLFWGKELTCFYNDAYRPTLGSDKHPALGMRAADIFPEAWEMVGPVLEGVVLTGEPVWFKDQLIPVFRNGKMEDVYWTFSYSPAYGDDGSINGVFVSCNETTEKVMLRQTLEENDSLFRTLAEGTDILISAWGPDGKASYYNNAWKEFTGRNIEDLKDYGWAELIHPDDKATLDLAYRLATSGMTTFKTEYRLKCKNGYRWILVTAPPRFSHDGDFLGYIGASIDITERREAEENFNVSNKRLQSVVESAPFPIAVYIGREMRIVLANQTIMDVWGKGNNVVGKTYYEVLPELEGQGIYPTLENVLVSGMPFHARNQRVDLVVDGTLQPFYFNYSFTPLFDADGTVYGVMNTAADVTDLNVATQQAARSEQNFRNLIMQAPVAMCLMLGPEHTVEIANESMISLWGKPRQDVMSRPIFEGLPDARQQGLEELLDQVYRTGEAFTASEMPVTLVRYGNPEIVYQNFVYEPHRDTDGTIIGVLAISIDVSPQVQARRKIEDIIRERTFELEQANSSLQRSNADLAQFAYIASHDLQEPLRKIRVFTQMLEARINETLDDQSAVYIEKIKSSSERMQALIRDVLTYSGIAKENELYMPVDLTKIIQDNIADFELLIEQKNAVVHMENLPVIEAIPLQMSQLFGNLVSNSLKFAREGIAPAISLIAKKMTEAEKQQAGCTHEGTYYHIKYSDNGIGFKPEYADKIFNIFQRLHGKSEYEGTGIGLAMCRKIAENHNGALNAIGSSEKGAVFNLYLPEKRIATTNNNR